MKKSILSIIIASIFLSNVAFSEEGTDQQSISPNNTDNIVETQVISDSISKNDFKNFDIKKEMEIEKGNIKHLYLKNPELFTTNNRNSEDLELESLMIEKFKEKFFDKKEDYSQEEYDELMNSYFVDALKTGNRNLADEILFNSGANIDLEYMSKNPINNPLMAIASSFAYDGGDIEYFIKLVKMGANPSFKTDGSRMSLMSLAANVDNYKIVLYLISIGENPMYLDDFDYYAMDYAVKNDSTRTIIILSKIITEYQNQLIENKNKE